MARSLFRFKDKDGTEVGSGYSMTAQLFLDLAREIFLHDILSGKHPEAVLLERSLNSAANGKVNFFFRDAKFNGLDQLPPEEAASELRSYKRFLLRISPMPSAVESVLFHAFIQAATFTSPENLIPLRRQIINFMNSESEAKK
jgi:hypothetical protein